VDVSPENVARITIYCKYIKQKGRPRIAQSV